MLLLCYFYVMLCYCYVFVCCYVIVCFVVMLLLCHVIVILHVCVCYVFACFVMFCYCYVMLVCRGNFLHKCCFFCCCSPPSVATALDRPQPLVSKFLNRTSCLYGGFLPTPNPQPGGLGYPFQTGLSPLTLSGLTRSYSTASLAIGII